MLYNRAVVGPGTYQFEMGGSNTTAVQRLENFEKTYGPVSLRARQSDLISRDPDFSQLSEDAQSAILVADWTMKLRRRSRRTSPRRIPDRFWAQHHWAGDPVTYPESYSSSIARNRYERLGYPQ